MKRSGVVRITIVVLAFLLGMLAGGWAARKRHWRGWDPQKRQERMMQRFSSKLDLTEQQKAAIAGILETSHQRMQSLHDQVRPQFETLRTETSQQIRAHLTPEQSEKFDTLEAEFAKRWEKRGKRWAPRGAEPATPSRSQQEELR